MKDILLVEVKVKYRAQMGFSVAYQDFIKPLHIHIFCIPIQRSTKLLEANWNPRHFFPHTAAPTETLHSPRSTVFKTERRLQTRSVTEATSKIYKNC